MKRVDLRQYALNLLKLSRKFFLEDGDLDPTAFIIVADEQLLRPVDLCNEARKTESCAKLVDEARQRNALAIITIFLARSKDSNERDFDQDAYTWGDIQSTRAERCILLTMSGPGVKNWAVALPFKTAGGKIIFGKRVEFKDGVDLGLFPGWSEQIIGLTAS